MANAKPVFLTPRISLAAAQGFCANGAYLDTIWLNGEPRGIHVWGSFCNSSNKGNNVATTTPFPAPAHLRLYVAGYPLYDALPLSIERLSDHKRLSLQILLNPGSHWIPFDYSLPPSWRTTMVRIIAQDQNNGKGGWFGFSEPLLNGAGIRGVKDAATLLLKATLHLVLTVLPCLALCMLALYKGVRDTVLAGCIALAGTGISGYLVFWVWFAWPRVGHALAFLLVIASLACVIWFSKRLDQASRGILKSLLAPALLVAAASLLVTTAGFAYGGMRTPLETAWTRFSHPLPPDNMIPYLFADAVRSGTIPKPLIGDWESSDRPPLQSGIFLSQTPYSLPPRPLAYEILGIISQSLWIFALWLFLTALQVDQRAIALALAVCLFSGFVFANTFYVWPKLLSASYTLGAFAILLSRGLAGALRRGSKPVAITTGALLAFGLLAHGGSIFAILGFIAAAPVLRRRFSYRSLALIAGSALLAYLPWFLYQKVYDPPGDRLLKYHLAGVKTVDPRPFGQVFMAAYGHLTLPQILNNKERNFVAATDHKIEYWSQVRQLLLLLPEKDSSSESRLAQTGLSLRMSMFFYFAPCLGFLIVGLPALLAGIFRRFRSAEWNAAVVMWVFVAFTVLIWCVLMFGPDAAVIHQGAYVMVLLAFCGSILALWSLSHALAYITAALQIALNFVLYAALMRDSLPNAPLLEGLPRYASAALALLSAILVLFLLKTLARKQGARLAPECTPRIEQQPECG